MQILLKFIHRFGYLNGLFLFFRINYGKVTDLTITGFKGKITLRRDSVDLNVFRHVIVNEDYAINLSFEPKVIIDAGAFIGLSTVDFANRYPESTIIAVEPDDDNFQLLTKNINGYSNVKVIKSGLWNEITRIRNYKQGNHHCGNTIKTSSEEEDDSFNAVTVNSIIQDYDIDTIDLFKIDIEGAEKELFEFNSDGWLQKTRCIIIEIHDNKKEGCSKSVFGSLMRNNFMFWKTQGENLIFLKG